MLRLHMTHSVTRQRRQRCSRSSMKPRRKSAKSSRQWQMPRRRQRMLRQA